MPPEYAAMLAKLIGLPLLPVGAAADMLWIHFGTARTVPTRKNGTKEVGDWALHLQCPWRFVRENTVLLASSDFYYVPETGKYCTPGAGDESVFRRAATHLNQLITDESPAVREVRIGQAGAFEIIFSGNLTFSVMPVHSDYSAGESWRFFDPGSDASHFVFPEEKD